VLLIGGTEIQTLNLVYALVSDGYHVIVCCYYEYEEAVVSMFRSAGAKVILLSLKRSNGMFSLIRELRLLIKSQQPNIIHVQYLEPGLIPIIAAKLSGVRTVFATVHHPGRPYGLKEKLLLRLGACLCTAFFCVSRSGEESWFGDSVVFNPQKDTLKRKHFTIYNGVDSLSISRIAGRADSEDLRKSLGLNGRPVIGIVGRLRSEKGHSILLKAMTAVIKTLPEVMLLVIGDGPDRDYLRNKAKALGIVDHILWLGAKKPEEIFELYSVMDIVAVPSLFEGFCLTAAEAMAACRSVVASNVEGLREVIKDGVTGYLVPVGDSNLMAKRLVELLSNPSKAKTMGEAGCERVKQQFSLERYSEATVFVYRKFLSQHNSFLK
jgi:glycosyltransferase involved in cell wall biosynthesis